MPTSLAQLQIGQQARITQVGGQNPLRQRLLDMGLVRGAQVQVVNQAPLGGPLALNVCGYNLALRRAAAELIQVELLEPRPLEAASPAVRRFEFTLPALRLRPARRLPAVHPARSGAARLPSATILLAGNPNCGKSTLFNALTGAHQHVGNWPGKTVERKEGLWLAGPRACRVIDLPGVYSLTAYSMEEIVARDAILQMQADLVVVVMDAANLERNLYLALQIMEMGARVVLALNMWDVAQSQGLVIDREKLAARLGVPVVPTALNQGGGLEELQQTILQALEGQPVHLQAARPICASACAGCH